MPMVFMVATERHLWLKLSGIKEKDKNFLLDAPVTPTEFFKTAIETVVEKFREARTQSAAFRKCIPFQVQASSSPSDPSPGTSYWREGQKESVERGQRHCTRRKPKSDRRACSGSCPFLLTYNYCLTKLSLPISRPLQ